MTLTTTPAPLAEHDVFTATVERLSRQSVDKHFEAYTDVAWDDPDMAIDVTDPRFASWRFDPLARAPWYAEQTDETKARLGAYRVAVAMRTGWEFENILQRGLLELAFRMPNFKPEFRYLHHEVIEESQHTLMFQEFVNRTGFDVSGMPRAMKAGSRVVVGMNRLFPELFFFFVLGGEDPVDYLQRRQLRGGDTQHPLVERIMRIHVTEEARHISFARQYLKKSVPALGFLRRHALSVITPFLFGTMARLMVFPSKQTVRTFGVPRGQVRQALRHPDSRQLLHEAVSKPRKLCSDLGLMTPVARTLWKLMGVWADPADASASAGGTEALDEAA